MAKIYVTWNHLCKYLYLACGWGFFDFDLKNPEMQETKADMIHSLDLILQIFICIYETFINQSDW